MTTYLVVGLWGCFRVDVKIVHQEKQAGGMCVMAWGLAKIVVEARTAAAADVNPAHRANIKTVGAKVRVKIAQWEKRGHPLVDNSHRIVNHVGAANTKTKQVNRHA